MRLKEKLRERARRLEKDTVALYLALKREETPLSAKIVVGFAICYALSPIDLIPDFIPIIGFLDDVLILPALVALAVRLIPEQTFSECREKAIGMWENGKPKSFWYALPIIVFWLAILAVVVRSICF
jgi:uncharacterized membrane protein YkvA (DUF1232 family)